MADPDLDSEDGADEAPGIVDLVIEDDRWLDADLLGMSERAARGVGEWLQIQDFQIVVLGCDDKRIAGLNAEFRGKPKPTNVLSWPTIEFDSRHPGAHPKLPDIDELGDIAISYDTCWREAEAQGKPFADHATHLLVHAMLHLAGYDHIDDQDAETMEDSERSILGKLGIADPYLELET